MGRSYKKVPTIKNRENGILSKDEIFDEIFYCKNFKEIIKKRI